ncbi:hypothetical protein CTI12_AA616250 [Artemisia annua]|uniref:Replication protein A 70 kDa DNA-binding subunit B/D first OB fold domain-containing protein n=1 Tax=Artemisia annua TaxID=35608 RepID=A0A2U1KDC9_ARTAN|nr:hypothetical protein CTI12_AA616250 [Artemisia annua]
MALTVDPAASEKNTEASIIPPRQLAYLTELSPADNTKFIEVRVYRKWTAVKVPGFTPISFSCILLDKKGSAIQANTDLKEKARFDRDLQINSVYKIQGFGFEKADGWGKTLDNDFTLSFGKYTQIEQLSETNFPYHYFNFAAFNELNARLEKKNPILTGGQIQMSATSATRYYFNPDVEETRQLLAACELAGQIQMSATSATRYYFNPDVEETRQLLAAVYCLRKKQRYSKLTQIITGTTRNVTSVAESLHTDICTANAISMGPNQTLKTGNAVVSCFTPQTDGLIKDMNALLQEVENKDPATIPPAILALQNTRHVFQFQFATPTAKGPPTFVLKKIMDKPQAMLPASSAGPSSPPAMPITVNTDENYTPPPATPTVTQDTPIDVPAITIPPPDPSAKKELFPPSASKECGPTPKKHKKEWKVFTILYIYCEQ